jgi:hypothetical protein
MLSNLNVFGDVVIKNGSLIDQEGTAYFDSISVATNLTARGGLAQMKNVEISDDISFTKYNTSIPSYLKINDFNSSINNVNNTFTTLLNNISNTFVSTMNSISGLNNLIYSTESTSPSITTTVINPNNKLFIFRADYENGNLYQKEFTIDLINNYIYSNLPLILERNLNISGNCTFRDGTTIGSYLLVNAFASQFNAKLASSTIQPSQINGLSGFVLSIINNSPIGILQIPGLPSFFDTRLGSSVINTNQINGLGSYMFSTNQVNGLSDFFDNRLSASAIRN